MKFLAILLLLCVFLTASRAALKHPSCGEEFGKFGNCKARLNKWTYRRDTNECISFNFSGCQGNNNLFENKENCEKLCKN